MKKITKQMFKNPTTPTSTRPMGRFTKILSTLLVICTSFFILQAKELKLTRTPLTGNTLQLTTPAKIIRITRNAKSYSLWRNGKSYVNISQQHDVKGVLPPGNYTLRVSPGDSVTIYLSTTFQPENIILWGRQTKLTAPRWEGNYVTLSAPTRIVEAAYDGTEGMGIFNVLNRILYYLSPHNRANPGPRVIGGIGGKTLAGQTLPPGVYHIVPGRGTADGVVYGKIVLDVR